MSLVECVDCGNQINGDSIVCPQCGNIPTRYFRLIKLILAIFAAIVILNFILGPDAPQSSARTAVEPRSDVAALINTPIDTQAHIQ